PSAPAWFSSWRGGGAERAARSMSGRSGSPAVAASVVADPEFDRGALGGALVARAHGHALFLRHREQLAGKREHDALFHELERLHPLAAHPPHPSPPPPPHQLP